MEVNRERRNTRRPEALGSSSQLLRKRAVGDLRFEGVMAGRVLFSAAATRELSGWDLCL